MSKRESQIASPNTYSVSYSGKILEGFTIKASASLLQQKAGMNTETIKKLIPLKGAIIKKNVSLEAAQNLVNILRECGLDCTYSGNQANIRPIQNTVEHIAQQLSMMKDEDLLKAFLSLGKIRAGELALSIMKQTAKDSFGTLKESAEGKLSSIFTSVQQAKPKTEIEAERHSFEPATIPLGKDALHGQAQSKKSKAFAVYRKHGARYSFWGPKFTTSLVFSEKIACFSWLACFLGVWVYLFTGLWRKAFAIVGLITISAIVCSIFMTILSVLLLKVIPDDNFDIAINVMIALPVAGIVLYAILGATFMWLCGRSYYFDVLRKNESGNSFWW